MGCFQRVLGMIQGGFRVDAYRNYIAVSINAESFSWVSSEQEPYSLGRAPHFWKFPGGDASFQRSKY